jgi:hypothetical protein
MFLHKFEFYLAAYKLSSTFDFRLIRTLHSTIGENNTSALK